MKKYKLVFFFIIFQAHLFSQPPQPFSVEDSLKIAAQVDREAKELRAKLNPADYISEYHENLDIEFTIDTFRIERFFALQLDVDYSTLGMTEAIFEAEQKYDRLLNQYYKRILARMDEEGQAVLRNAQRNWIAFRDSEIKLNYELMSVQYTGGGSMYRIIGASRVLELTKNRVVELVGYLENMAE